MPLVGDPSEEFSKFIAETTPIVIASHDKPDGDCLGSSVALAHYLQSRGRQVLLFNPGPFARQDIRHYKQLFTTTVPKTWLGRTADLLIVDCASVDRLGNIGPIEGFARVGVLDHHSEAQVDGDVRYICPQAPACSLVVQRLIETERPLHREEAEHILFAFLCDSGFFRHIDKEPGEIFSYLTRLFAFDFSLRDLYRKMNGGVKLSQHHLIGAVLQKSQQYLQGKLIIAVKSQEDGHLHSGYTSGEAVYSALILTAGVEVVALINELPERGFDVSLRATNLVNVGKLASLYGGGGHAMASGFRWSGDLDQLKMKLIQNVSELLPS